MVDIKTKKTVVLPDLPLGPPSIAKLIKSPQIKDSIPLEVWFHARKFRRSWWGGMKAFAQEANKTLDTLQGWDSFFKDY